MIVLTLNCGLLLLCSCRGANPLARNDHSQTTLHYHRGRPNILELLLQYVQESHVNAKVRTPAAVSFSKEKPQY